MTEKPWWRDWRQTEPDDWQEITALKVLVIGLGVVAVAGSIIAFIRGYWPAALLLLGGVTFAWTKLRRQSQTPTG